MFVALEKFGTLDRFHADIGIIKVLPIGSFKLVKAVLKSSLNRRKKLPMVDKIGK